VTSAFILKLVLSFFVGGLWITGGVALAERRGSKAGGLVLGFPSTVLLAIVFIGWTLSPQAAALATSTPFTSSSRCRSSGAGSGPAGRPG
jgi:hypothetical protein